MPSSIAFNPGKPTFAKLLIRQMAIAVGTPYSDVLDVRNVLRQLDGAEVRLIAVITNYAAGGGTGIKFSATPVQPESGADFSLTPQEDVVSADGTSTRDITVITSDFLKIDIAPDTGGETANVSLWVHAAGIGEV